MQAFIGLGSNLDQPAQRLISALHALQRLPGIDLLSHSRLYRSAPIGPQDQPDYVNAVARLQVNGTPTSYFTPSRPWSWPPAANGFGTGASARWIWISCYWTASTSTPLTCTFPTHR